MRNSKLLISVAVSAALAAPLAQADNTTVGGVLYTDFTSISTTQDQAGKPSTNKDPNGLGLDVKRAYLIFNQNFDDVWSANVTTDFNFPKLSVSGTDSNGDTVTASGNAPETQVFIKKAYVQGKFDPLLVLKAGSSDMPWIPFVEGVYGYRFVENTLTDRFGFANSADWGVNLSGANDTVNYSVSVVNGGGYKNPNRSKTMDEEGRIAFTPFNGDLTIALGAYTGKRGKDMEAAAAANTASRQDVLLAWKASGLTLGLEWFSADKWNDVTNPGATNKSDGTSLFASYAFPDTQYSIFGRYDDMKPLKDPDSSQEDKYFNVGFAWNTGKNVTWAVAYKNDKFTDNLKLGNTSNSLKTQEFGVWAQVKF